VNTLAQGRGKYQLRLTVDGLINEYLFSCVYQPDVQCNLLAAERIKESLGLYYDSNDFSIRELDTDRIVGTTETRDHVPCIRIAYNEIDGSNTHSNDHGHDSRLCIVA
jgi:hypothetical protein